MPRKGRWKFRKSQVNEDAHQQDLLQERAREYMLDGENVYLICERCKMAVREAAREEHDLREHGLYNPAHRMDPTREEYEAGLDALAEYVERRRR